MLRHITEWFKDSAGLAITIGLITVLLLAFSAARHFSFTASQSISEPENELGSLSIERYHGIKISGSAVINAVKRYQEELPVTVNNGTTTTSYHGSFHVENNKRFSRTYIAPSQVYGGYVLKDSNGMATGLKFVEESQIVYESSDKEDLAGIVGMNPEESSMDQLLTAAKNQLAENQNSLTVLTNTIKEMEKKKKELQQQLASADSDNASLRSQAEELDRKLLSLKDILDAIHGDYLTILGALADKGVNTGGNIDSIIKSIHDKNFKLKKD